VFREEVDRCAQILQPLLGLDIRSVIHPQSRSWQQAAGPRGIDLAKMLGREAGAAQDQDAANLNRTLHVQPALFTIEYAMTRVWQSMGVVPEAIVGHSMGEYVAACLAGVLSLADALRLVATRARLVDRLPEAGMLAVTLPEDELLSLLPAGLSISLINGPSLCVAAGPVHAVAELERLLGERGVLCRRVRNAHAFHSRLLEPIAQAFEEEVGKVRLHAPRLPYISNVSGTWITADEATSPAYWARHATRTARFGDALRELWRFKDPVLLEAGPGRTLSVLAMQHPHRRAAGEPVALSSIRHAYENCPDAEFLWQSIGRLWLAGSDISWDNAPRERRRKVPLPTYPFERRLHWLEPLPAADAVPRSQASIRKIADPAHWLYAPSWKRQLPRSLGIGPDALPAEQAGTWLIHADDSGFASMLAARLTATGHSVVSVRAGSRFLRADARSFTIEPGNAQHYDALIRALQASQALPDRIVHAWSLGAGPAIRSESKRFARAQAQGFYSLLYLAKALAANDVRREMALFALSSGVHEVCGSEALCPEKSTLLGPCMVIRQEYPNLRVKSIDVDVPARGRERESAADLVLGELLDPDTSLFVAHRNGLRWVQCYEPAAGGAGPGRSPLRAGGVYLITGGLGGIGIAISEWLAAKYGARLMLTGRSILPARQSWQAWLDSHPADDPAGAKIRAIHRIEKLGGEVLYMNADAADLAAMRGVVKQTYRSFGALHGVIHGAGIVGQDGYCEIKDSETANCERHFQAKARGALVLEKVLEGKALDFCLLLSSLASVLGGIGQAAYASSNVYLDTIARRHNRRSGVPWLSVNWDVWRLRNDDPARSGFGGTLRELGMSAEEATKTLETVLARRAAGQLVVSTGDLDARIDQWIKLESLRAPEPGTRPAPQAGSDPPPRDATERQIASIWQEALGVDSVGINETFAELGGHSLLAVRIVAELRNAFRIDLPLRALFDAPTVAELSRYVDALVWAERPQRSVANTGDRVEIEL
ncbi:MAG: acyltransferase domain-containing protein, partial [Burkholderiales bacterium]